MPSEDLKATSASAKLTVQIRVSCSLRDKKRNESLHFSETEGFTGTSIEMGY
jgi:hypothetical protein